MLPETFQCYLVEKDAAGQICGALVRRRLDDLPQGDVLIRVAYSSLNYKDALAATGHPGVNHVFPHVPGVDAAGVVAASGVYEVTPHDRVLVTGFDMGANRWGGYAEYVRVPQDWVIPLPQGFTLQESMVLGTAGFTAGLCVDALQKHGVGPDSGEVVVTGASGGVGCCAVALLAKLGYRITAISGKPGAWQWLRELGAQEVLGREAVDDRGGRPLLSGRWAGGIDTVGGNTLGTIIRALRHDGCVAACGLAGGHELPVTVYPFILRAAVLAGVDAAFCPLELRHLIWSRLGGPWRLDCLAKIVSRVVDLPDLPPCFQEILQGKVTGRIVVRIGGMQNAE
jgi:putative YhdH/YhfP family quinone oxidoreductase